MSDRFDFSKHSLTELRHVAATYDIDGERLDRAELTEAIKDAADQEEENAAQGNDIYFARMLARIKDGTFDQYLPAIADAVMTRRLVKDQRRSEGVKPKKRTKLS